MALSVPDPSVKIGEETFSLLVIPKAESELVKKAKTSLLGELDLESLVADFGKLGKIIRVAYNGVAGETELQIKVQRVGNKITKLTDESAVNVQELQSIYQILLDGLEEMALKSLYLLANVAEDMAKAAEGLQKKFEDVTTDVIDALEDTQMTKGSHEKHKKELKRRREDFEIQRQKAEQFQKDAMEARKKAEEYYEKAQNTNAEKIRHLDVMQKQTDIQQKASQHYSEFTEKIKNCKDDEGLEQVAIEALHNSIGALKSLSAIMMNAALFWRQMQEHCESLAKADMQKLVECGMKYPEEKRLKAWTSTAFKKKAIIYYSKWVALDDVCGTYMEQIKKTRQDLYRYLEENPTIEESRKIVRQLVASFAKELKELHEKMLPDSKAS